MRTRTDMPTEQAIERPLHWYNRYASAGKCKVNKSKRDGRDNRLRMEMGTV
jgi:hypothetical protein